MRFIAHLIRCTIILLFAIGVTLMLAPTVKGQSGIGNPLSTGPATLNTQFSSTCSSASCLSINLGGYTGVGIQVTGTCGTCTLNFESTVDGSTWVAQNMLPSNSATAAASTSAVGVWYGGMVAKSFRARLSARSTGSFVVTIRAAPNGG